MTINSALAQMTTRDRQDPVQDERPVEPGPLILPIERI